MADLLLKKYQDNKKKMASDFNFDMAIVDEYKLASLKYGFQLY